MTDLVHVKGLSELQAFLDQLPAKIERNVLRGALRAGAKPVLEDARRRAPTAPPSGKNERVYGLRQGALRDSLRISVKVRGGKVTASVKAGGRKKGDVYYARFVEYGTRPHTIKARGGGALAFGGGFLRSVEHPGATPHPFLRPALDTRAGDAVVAAGEYIKTRLATKHGIDTSDITIEVEE